MKKRFLWLCIGLIALLIASIAVSYFSPTPVISSVTLHPLFLLSPDGTKKTLEVEWADTDAKRAYGLMNRATLQHGMLFLFEDEQSLNFWMKNTLIPLDIVYFDANGEYVSSTTMTPCIADPCVNYPSEAPAKFALEMPAGFLQQSGIGQGWRLHHQ